MCLRPAGRHLQLLPHQLQEAGRGDRQQQQGGQRQEGRGGQRREGGGHPGQHRPGGRHCAVPQVSSELSEVTDKEREAAYKMAYLT